MPMLLPPFDQDTPFSAAICMVIPCIQMAKKTSIEVMNFYQDLGYDFIALSDHLWDDVSFASTTINDTRDLDRDDFVTIPSAELHCLGKRYDQDGLWHLVANGLPLISKWPAVTKRSPK